MPITEITVNSLGDLIDKVTPTEPDPRTGRRRDSGVYRGDGDARWPMLTSLDKLGGAGSPHTKVEPPTRLLDWTYSPLVAAHFATLAGDPGSDRVVWRLDWKSVHRFFGLPDLAMLIQDLDDILGPNRPMTPWALFSGAANAKQFACMIEPPSLSPRIVAQSATFTRCSDKRLPFDRFLESHGLGSALTKFIIPARETDRFRDQLDLVTVDERRLFPDLDGVAAEMRRYYS